MLVAEQIVHGLHWVECTERNLYEYCIPVAHRTIPKTWQLECLQILTILTLAGDETGRWINELRKIEGIALVILGRADEIYRVEVSTLGEHLHILLVILVNLRALQNLKAYRAILIIGKEWTTTRLAHVLNDTADTHRTVQLLTQIDNQFGILQLLDISLTAAEVALNEADNLLQLLMVVLTRIQNFQIIESLLLQSNQYTCNHLLPGNSLSLQAIRNHIVNILDEYHISIYLVEVLDECTMTARTEQQRAILVAERSIVWIGSDGIGARLLL